MQRFLVLIAIILASLLPCVTYADDPGLMIHDPYVRLVPPGTKTSGTFMVIKNTSSVDRQLLKAESPAAQMVQLHTHLNENGVMKMREVQNIDIKANSQTELKPGGYHIMLINLMQELKEGDIVPITLSFDDGSKKLIQAPVRKLQMNMPSHKGTNYENM